MIFTGNSESGLRCGLSNDCQRELEVGGYYLSPCFHHCSKFSLYFTLSISLCHYNAQNFLCLLRSLFQFVKTIFLARVMFALIKHS